MRRYTAILAIAGVLLTACTAKVGSDRAIALEAACVSSTPVVGSAQYHPGPGVHKIAILQYIPGRGLPTQLQYEETPYGGFGGTYPPGWRGDLVETELIACTSDRSETQAESCVSLFADGRTQVADIVVNTARVDLLAAATGEVVDEVTLYGATPVCEGTLVPRQTDSPLGIHGGLVPWTAVEGWLRSYVDQP